MEVTYKKSKKEIFYIYWYRMLRIRILYLMAVLFPVGFVLLDLSKNQSCTPSIISIVTTFLYHFIHLVILYGGLLLIFSIISIISKKVVNQVMIQTTTKIAEDGIVIETPQNTTHFTWAGVVDVRQTKRFMFLYVSPNGSYAIPKRAFASAQAAEDFYRTAYDYWQAAKK